MKKIILIAVLLISSIFYISTSSFKEIGTFNANGTVFVNNDIQNGLYNTGEKLIEPVSVKADDKIYERWGSNYVTDKIRKKINVVYPMFINEGVGIKFQNYGNDLFDTSLNKFDGYDGLIINDGEAYDELYERADYNDYVLARLNNNLYINTHSMDVKTIANEYDVSLNSFMYLTPENITFYEYSYGDFKYGRIDDVNLDSTVTIGELEISYGDLLKELGEISEIDETQGKDKTENELPESGQIGETKPGNVKDSKKNENDTDNETSGDASDAIKGQEAKMGEGPDLPSGSIIPGPTIEREDDEPEKPIDVTWVMPEVKPNNIYTTSAYTVKTNINVNDPASAIYKKSLTYEILMADGDYAGRVLRRYTIPVSDGNNEVIITGLEAQRQYKIRAYYKYYDKYRELVNDPIWFIEDATFTTKDVTDLGTIYIAPIDMSKTVVYNNRVNIPDINFLRTSDYDAVSSINKIVVELTDDAGKTNFFALNNDNTNRLKNFEKLSYATPSNLSSSTHFTGRIVCYDKYSNELQIENNTFEGQTCKKPPTVVLDLQKPEIDTIKFKVDITMNDELDYENLRAYIIDSNGEIVQIFGSNYVLINPNEEIVVPNLGLNKTYSLKIAIDADILDGKGKTEQVLYSKTFTTGLISSLGNLYLTGKNTTKEHLLDTDDEIATRAFLTLSINNSLTNKDLPQYVDALSISFTNDNEVYTYALSSEQLEALKNKESIEIDTNSFIKDGLKSDTTYFIKYVATSFMDDLQLNIPVTSSYNVITMPKNPMKVEIYSLQAYTGFITSKFKIKDLDNICVGDEVLLRVIKKEAGNKTSVIGSYNIPKNEEYDLRMFADPESSSDGQAHKIEADTTYMFKFIAREANLSTGIKINYTIKEVEFSTEQGMDGNIILSGLKEFSPDDIEYRQDELPEGYKQIEYIESTGTQYIDTLYNSSINGINSLRMVTDFTITNTSGWRVNGVTGSSGLHAGINGSNILYYSVGKGDVSLNVNYTLGDRIITDNDAYNKTISFFNVTKNEMMASAVTNPSTVKNQFNMSLFAYTSSAPNNPGSKLSGRLYSCQIYDNNEIVRDFIPAINNNGIIGLYDVVNDTFYENKGTGTFKAGNEVIINSEGVDSDKYYNARLRVNVSENTVGATDWLESNTVYIDAYKYEQVGGVYNKIKVTDNPLEVHYTDAGGTYYVDYPVLKDSNPNNYYLFELYFEFVSGEGDNRVVTKVKLGETKFSTEECIYTISNMNEFFGIGTSNHKYVVINDLNFHAMYYGRDDTATYYEDDAKTIKNNIHWRSGGYFDAKVDFQGYTLDLSGNGPLIYRTTRNAEIKNAVIKVRPDAPHNSTVYYGRSNIVYYNYGSINNCIFEYSEDFEYPYMYDGYWTTEKYASGVTQHRYINDAAICGENYGTIENFAINCKTPVVRTVYSGMATLINRAGGVVRNGYLYSSETDDNKAQFNIYNYSNNQYGALVGYNQSGATIENVFAIADVNLVAHFSDYTSTGIIAGRNEGIVRNCYAVGDTTYNKGNLASYSGAATSYGPAVGYTGNYVNKNIYYVSKYSYISSNSSKYNNVASLLALRNKTWQESILNSSANSNFNVGDLVDVSCYPQIKFVDECMPIQDYIPLPEPSNYSTIDLIYSYSYEIGSNPDIDDIFTSHDIEDDIGNRVWQKQDGEEIFSNLQPFIALISNYDALPLDSITINGMKCDIYQFVNDGKGVSTVYGVAYNPTQAKDRYIATDLYFKDTQSTETIHKSLDSGRYINTQFFRCISSPEEWIENLHGKSDALSQNYVLTSDIDFNNEYTLSDMYINGTYTGIFDGNNKTVKNIKFISLNESVEGNSDTFIGLFRRLDGTVKDLRVESIYFEGGRYTGLIAGELYGGTISNTFVNKAYVAGRMHVGGLAGVAHAGSNIIDSGIKNVKLLTTNDGDVGGIVGLADGLVTISNDYAQNIYIESFYGQRYTGAGGILGVCTGSYTDIDNCYATGVIIGSVDGIGGILGVSSVTAYINNSYADVDLISYTGGAGGIVGRAINNSIYVTDSLSFGNVLSGNILKDDDDRTLTFSPVCYDTNRFATGRYFDESKLDVATNSQHITSSDRIGEGSFSKADAANYLIPNTYLIEDSNYLPLLLDSSGENVLYGQDKQFVGNSDVLSLSNVSYHDNKLDVVFDFNADDISIEDIYFDYGYVEDLTGLNYKGTNSYSNHDNFNLTLTDKTIDHIINKIEYVYNVNSINVKQDLYRITGVKYKYNGEEYFLRINEDLPIGKQERVISNIGEWESTFKDGGSYMENITIQGDIDFNGKKLYYNDEGLSNVVVNRINGTKNNDETSYLGIKEFAYDGVNTFPFYRLYNASIGKDYDSNHSNWLYDYNTGLIRTVVTECTHLSFDSINVDSKYNGGVICVSNGDLNNITFTNSIINSPNTHTDAGYNGSVSFNNALVRNVYINNQNVKNAYNGVGIFAGYAVTNKRHVGINNVVIENSTASQTNASYSYVGAIAGMTYNSGYNFFDGSSLTTSSEAVSYKIINCIVNNCLLTNAGNYTGGITGNATYSVYIDNCNVLNSSIIGNKSYTGGIVGYNYGNSCVLTDNYIYKTEIRGQDYTGGISGALGTLLNNVVEECIVIGKGNYTGGAYGRALNSWIDRKDMFVDADSLSSDDKKAIAWVKNTKIYGNTYVGGIAGWGTGTSIDSTGFVLNSEIYGNNRVGGAVGQEDRYCVISTYINNSIIAPITKTVEGISKSASQQYFGGVVGYGGRAVYGFVDNCVIGGPTVDYVGGVYGRTDYYENAYIENGNICRDSVVYGNKYVGGLYGQVITVTTNSGTTNVLAITGNYSNAYVVGYDNVAGIAGDVSAYYYKSGNNYTCNNMPVIENSYFTGVISSANNASAIFGNVLGNNLHLSLNGLVSMPESITGKVIEPILIDGDLNANSFYYNWSNLLEENDMLKVSLWANTIINEIGKDASTMESLLLKDKYKNNYSTNVDDIEVNFDGGNSLINHNRKFIYLYKDAGQEFDPGVIEGYGKYRNLPEGYTQVEYLKHGGSTIIDTEQKFNYDSEFRIEAEYLIPSIGPRYLIFGTYSGSPELNVEVSSSNIRTWMNGGSIDKSIGTIMPNTVIKVTYEWNPITKTYVTTLNGMELTGTLTSAKGESKNTLWLFQDHRGQGTFTSNSQYYSYKFIQNGITKNDLVPARRNSDGVLGMYDVITNKFHENVGKSEFDCGNVVEKTDINPSDYNDNAYIKNYIYDFSLTGNSKCGYTSLYSMLSIQDLQNNIMPHVKPTTGSSIWESYSYSTLSNPITGDGNNITIIQGVHIPGTPQSINANKHTSELFVSYSGYLSGNKSLEDLYKETGIGFDDMKIFENDDVYMVDSNLLNIDFSNSQYNTYTQLEYLEHNGTTLIDTQEYFNYNNSFKVEAEYEVSSIGPRYLIFGSYSGSPELNVEVSGKNLRMWMNSGSQDKLLGTITENSKFKAMYEWNANTKEYRLTLDEKVLTGTLSSASGIFKNTIWLFQDHRGQGTFTAHSKLYSYKYTQGGIVLGDFVPARRDSDGVLGMYDRVTHKFYTNKGTGEFIGGPATSVNTLSEENSMSIYTVSRDNSENILSTLVDNKPITKRTYSIQTDLLDNIKVSVHAYDENGTPIIYDKVVDPRKIALRATSYDSYTYYIDPNDSKVHIYTNADSSNVFIDKQIVSVYGNKAVDAEGYLYENGTKGSKIETKLLDESIPLYEFEYKSNKYYTYGTYTYIDYGNYKDALSLNRYYLKDNKLYMLTDGLTSAPNDYYVYGAYEAYLKSDQSFKSIGSTKLDFLSESENSGILHISSNFSKTSTLSVNSPIVSITYTNGDITLYNTATKTKTNIKRTVSSLASPKKTSLFKSLTSYLSNSLSSIFDIEETSTTDENREAAEGLVNIMKDNGINELNDVIEAINESDEDVNHVITLKGKSYTLSDELVNTIKNNISNNDEYIPSIRKNDNTNTAIEYDEDGNVIYQINTPQILRPTIKDVTDGNYIPSKVGDGLITNDNSQNDFVLSYNEKTDDFDIYSEKELIENPEDPISQNARVIDKSTLKSLYQALADENKDDQHGITLYVLIAIAIMTLSAIIVVSNKIKR